MPQDPVPTPVEASLVGQHVGKYELLRVVGRGGMGTVYEALNTTIQKRVAMKCIDASLVSNPDAIARFQREALAASAVDSPHIVQIFDAGSTPDGTPFIVMELLRGRDLGSWLGELGRMTPSQALSMASQLLRGLGHAHAAGIVHRDLKPDNIFIAERSDEPPTVKILDFGVSKIAAGTKSALKTLTREGTIVGTPYYMSPEQAQGFPDVDGRTDLYSVGAIVFECLAGRPPHVGDVYEQVIVSICMKDADDVRVFNPSVSEPLAAALARALRRERHDRYGSPREMLDALLAAGPPELRALASATPSGVLRIDIGREGRVPTTPFGSPALVTDRSGAILGAGASSGDAAPALGLPPAGVPAAGDYTPSPSASGEREAHSTLPSGAPSPLASERAHAAFAATVRADSGVTSVGPASSGAEPPAKSGGRVVALTLSGLLLAAAVAVIGLAVIGENEPSAGVGPEPGPSSQAPGDATTASPTSGDPSSSLSPTDRLATAAAAEPGPPDGAETLAGAPTSRTAGTGSARATAPSSSERRVPPGGTAKTVASGAPSTPGQPSPKPSATGLHILTE